MELEWTDDMSVGNGVIDADHKILLGMVNGVVHAIELADCTVISQSFELFDSRLRTHFENEESIARTIKFPFTKHKQAQQYYLKELDLLKDELLARGGVWCKGSIMHYSDSMRTLMIEHITRKDMLMKPSLQSYPYNFNPLKL